MDPHKKLVLLEWLNALSEKSVTAFEDLHDGSIIVHILTTVGDDLIPCDAILESVPDRFQAIQKYIEGIYNQSFEDRALIDFHVIQRQGVDPDQDVAKEVYEMEMSKMLLVLLCSVILDHCREPFLRPAFTMDERSQIELKDMIEFVVSNASGMQLRPDFAEVLKRRSESSTHVDAAIFLKLVADGVPTSPAVVSPSVVTPEPSSGPVSFTFSNSPQVAQLKAMSIRDISSPLRVMSLSSPLGTPHGAGARVSPLGVLMQSPQMVQKTRFQDVRRLELALKNEQHLRFEFEQDLKERDEIIDEKDNRARELEARVAEVVRSMRDQLDELEALRSEKEKQDEDLVKLRSQLAKRQDMKEQYDVLEKENASLTFDLQKAWDELKSMESVRHSSDEFSVKCHNHQLEVTELQLSLQLRDEEIIQLRETVTASQAKHQSALQTCQGLRREKEDLEELLGMKNNSGLFSPSSGPESMAVVTEKRMLELQAECDQLRASWVDPDRHAAIHTQLQMEEQARKTFEEKFMEAKKQTNQQECKIENIEKELSEVQTQLQLKCTGHEALEEACEKLRQAEQRLSSELDTCKTESSKSVKQFEELNEAYMKAQISLKEDLASCNQIIVELRVDIEKLNEVIQELKSHNHEVGGSLEKSEMLVAQFESQVKSMQEEHSKEKSDFSSMIQQLELTIESNNQQFSEEKEKLESNLERVTSEYESKITALHNEMKVENEKQEKSIAELRISAEQEKSVFVGQMKNIEEELESRNQIIEEQKSEVEKLNKVIEELKLRICELDGSLEKSEMSVAQFIAQVKSMQEEHSKEKSDFSSMIQHLELTKENNNQQFSEEKGRLESNFARVTSEYETKITTLLNENEMQEKSIAELRISAEQEKSVFVGQMKNMEEELTSRNHDIDEQKSEVEKLSKVIEELKLRIQELDGSLEKSEMSVARFESQVKSMQEEHSKEKSDFSSMIQQLELTKESNNQQFSEEKDKLDSNLERVTSEYETKITTLLNEKEMQEKSIAELRISAEQEKSVFVGQMKNIEEELESRNQIIKEQKSEVEKLTKYIEELKLRIQELDGSLEKSEMSVAQFESQVKSMQEEHSKEKSDFSSMIQQLELTKESNNQQFSEEKGKLESDFARVTSEYETKITTLLNEKEMQEKSIAELRISAEHEKSVFVGQMKNMEEELASCNHDIDKQKSEVEKLSKFIEELKLRIQELDASLEKSEMSVAQFESQVKSMQEEHSKEKSDFSSMIQQLELTIESNNQQFFEEKEKLESDFATVASEHEMKISVLLKERRVENEKQEKSIDELRISAEQEKSVFVGQMKNIEEELASRNKIIEEQKSKVEKLTKVIEELKLRICELDGSYEKSEMLVARFESQVKNMQEEHSKEKSDFSSMIQHLELTKESNNQQFSEEKGRLERDFARVTSEYEAKITTLLNEKEMQEKSLAAMRISAEQEKRAFVGQMKDMEEELESRNQIIEEQKSEVEKLSQIIEELKLRIQELNGSLEKSGLLVAEFESQVKSMHEEHTKEKLDFCSMVQHLELTIVSNNQQFSEQKEKLESDLTKVTSEYEMKITALHNERKVEKELEGKRISELTMSAEEEKKFFAEHNRNVEQQLQEKGNCIMEMECSAIEHIKRIENLCSQLEHVKETLKNDKDENLKIKEEFETNISELKSIHQQNLCEKKAAIERLSSELSAHVKSHTITVEETENLKMKILAVEDEKNREIENLIERYETQLEGLRMEIASKEGRLKSEECTLQEKLKGMSERKAVLEADCTRAHEELRHFQEQLSWEKGEREEVQRQRDYIQDRNDTLSAELSSQQQQLAAVEEEKRVLEREVSTQCELRDRQQRFTQIEKLELERELQASQKCYEATQKSVTEMENQLERSSNERAGLETRNRELEQRIYSYLEREKRLMEDNQRQIDKAAELNGTLRRQLDQKCQDIQDINAKSNQELDVQKELMNEMKTRFEREARTLTEENTEQLEKEAATLQRLRAELDGVTAERNRVQEINEKYNIHYNKKKETIAELTQKLKQAQDELEASHKVEEKLLKETAPMREKLEAELMKNKGLCNKLRTLEAQVDLADRKLREVQDQSLGIFWGSGSDFQKMLNERENAHDASFFANHPSSMPSNDSFLQPQQAKRGSSLENTSSDKTLTGNNKHSSRSRRSSRSSSNVSVISNDKADTVSIGSASSLAYRLRSRESAASLNRSVNSVESGRSNASVPRGTGALFHCEDEPMEFEWGRLSELQRRNTLCPAHLKTAYPVETQRYRSEQYRDDALRESTISSKTLKTIEQSTNSRKRKPAWTSADSSSDSEGKNKQVKAGCVYQKPGPPTPANSRRNSGKGTGQNSLSPNSRRHSGKGSPRTPVLRSGRTPRRTPRKTPKRQAAGDVENAGSGKKLSKKRESVSFSVGFSPRSQGRTHRLRRQQGFVQKQPQSTSQNRKPLAARNFMQTGV